MRKFLFLCFLLINCNLYSQAYGKTKIQSTIPKDKQILKYNQWYSNNDYTYSFKPFSQSAIGIKSALSEVRKILSDNNVNFDPPLVDESFLSSLVTGVDDYEMLNISIKNESSEVDKSWQISEFDYVILSLKIDGYKVSLFKKTN